MFRRRASRRWLQQLLPLTRAEVSAKYWAELLQLLDEGEIDIDVARKIEGDLFEPEIAGQPRTVNEQAWKRYLAGHHHDLERTLLK